LTRKLSVSLFFVRRPPWVSTARTQDPSRNPSTLVSCRLSDFEDQNSSRRVWCSSLWFELGCMFYCNKLFNPRLLENLTKSKARRVLMKQNVALSSAPPGPETDDSKCWEKLCWMFAMGLMVALRVRLDFHSSEATATNRTFPENSARQRL
jgi:hypothetical protein